MAGTFFIHNYKAKDIKDCEDMLKFVNSLTMLYDCANPALKFGTLAMIIEEYSFREGKDTAEVLKLLVDAEKEITEKLGPYEGVRG